MSSGVGMEIVTEKKSGGRRRREIKKIENASSRMVTFTKRRHGLFKKAAKLSALTGAQIAVLVLSGAGRAYSYGNPNVESVMERYLSPADEMIERALEEKKWKGLNWWEVAMEGMGLEELGQFRRFLEGLNANVNRHSPTTDER